MHTHRPERIPRRLHRPDTLIHPDIPQLNFAIPTPGDQLTLPTALQVHIGDPLSVLLPALHHCGGGFLALVVDADGAVAEAGNEDVAFNLVGGEAGYAGAGAGGNVL